MKEEMDEINLHGVNYEDAANEIDRYINENWGMGGIPEGSLKIITGNSEFMRKTVINVLDLYGVPYRIGDHLGMTRSYIII